MANNTGGTLKSAITGGPVGVLLRIAVVAALAVLAFYAGQLLVGDDGHGDGHGHPAPVGDDAVYEIEPQIPGAMKEASRDVFFGTVYEKGQNAQTGLSDGSTITEERLGVRVNGVIKGNFTFGQEISSVGRLEGMGDQAVAVGDKLLFFTNPDPDRPGWHVEVAQPYGDRPAETDEQRAAFRATFEDPAPYTKPTPEPELDVQSAETYDYSQDLIENCPPDNPAPCTPAE